MINIDTLKSCAPGTTIFLEGKFMTLKEFTELPWGPYAILEDPDGVIWHLPIEHVVAVGSLEPEVAQNPNPNLGRPCRGLKPTKRNTLTMRHIYKEWPTLVKTARTGKSQFWQIRAWSDGNHFFTETEYWAEGGQHQTAPKEVFGKNLGRIHETSPLQQAISEAESYFKKQLDKGYSNPDDPSLTAGKLPLPMLAQDYTKRKHHLGEIVYAQPKLDGFRSLYQPGMGFWSRLGKVFSNTVDLSHLDLTHCVGPGAILDGELILPPPYTFQQTCEAIKKQRPETSLLQFHVFDLVLPEQSFQSRLSGLELLSREFPEPVNLVETTRVQGAQEIESLQAHYLEEGYEGLILRDAGGLYEVGHRSNSLLKFKTWVDEEFTIVSVTDGVGREKGAAIFECRTPEGAHFSCRPRGDYETRRAQFESADMLIGKRLTVRFQGYTTTEQPVPRFPIGMGVRYDG